MQMLYFLIKTDGIYIKNTIVFTWKILFEEKINHHSADF